MIDKHYTAQAIAERIVALLPERRVRTVADFAVGDGSLLRALAQRWPNAHMLATDIDPDAIRRVRSAFPGVRALGLDFLSTESHASKRLSRYHGSADIVFINPPFSCRGAAKLPVHLADASLTCSKAMAFLLETLRYRSSEGIVAAILPASCMTSEKDEAARSYLLRRFQLDVLGSLDATSFDRCSVQTVCVLVRPPYDEGRALTRRQRPKIAKVAFAARLSRGSTAVSNAIPRGDRGFLLAHTTDLQRNRLQPAKIKVKDLGLRVQGPCVLIPRVGRMRQDKICVVPRGRKVLMSDCLIAIETALESESVSLASMLDANFERLAAIYGGTCAPYTTLARVSELLSSLGVVVVPDRPTACNPTSKVDARLGSNKPSWSISALHSVAWPKLLEGSSR